MKFTVNGMEWSTKFVEKDSDNLLVEGTYRFGVCVFATNTIYIANNLTGMRCARTITHELTHAFIESHGMYSFKKFNHEQLCEFVANHNSEIERISDMIMERRINEIL